MTPTGTPDPHPAPDAPMTGRGLALWWLPPADVSAVARARIEALAARLAAPVFLPHVTLLSALAPEHAGDAGALLERVAAATGRPRLRPRGLSTAPAWNRCLVVELAAPPAAHAGRRAAAAALGLPPPGPFRPHLSLAYARLPASTRARLAEEPGPTLPPFAPAALALVDTRGPVEGWRVQADLSL